MTGAPGPPAGREPRRAGLRTGFTTGTCASAAAKAAALGLVGGVVPATVEVALPGGRRVRFDVVGAGPVAPGGDAAACVVKDAGDDPDCTDGAPVTATVGWRAEGAGAGGRGTGREEGRAEGGGADGGTVLVAGPGVGTVTKPGLGIPVGAPSITAVPRRMILAALAEVTGAPLRVVLSVPGGEAMAEKTTNARLGIVGGISILGTSGIVRPFSTAAYRASVVQQIDVAAAQGATSMVLCTGSRSEKAALAHFGVDDPVQVVEVGDYTGVALRRCAAAGMRSVDVAAMAGKIAKLAAGVMMTHFHRSAVDTDLLARVAREAGAPEAVAAAATQTETARHFYEACMAHGHTAALDRLCTLAAARCAEHAGGKLSVRVAMVDFEGDAVVARG